MFKNLGWITSAMKPGETRGSRILGRTIAHWQIILYTFPMLSFCQLLILESLQESMFGLTITQTDSLNQERESRVFLFSFTKTINCSCSLSDHAEMAVGFQLCLYCNGER
ncbi:hypothetical protein BDW74DRAFT_130749 [Aspergillus multicolor]|uniref:uncharacterized protein n=1 Tax=Aspergillus multicolor TaxID=41759 RepID=UPI003CCD870E